MTALLVYVTCADRDEAVRIGEALVQERLAACVNFRPHETIYAWEGQVERGTEYGLLAKTADSAYQALEVRVRTLHSYDLPCIVAWPIVHGLAPYLAWIAASIEAERT